MKTTTQRIEQLRIKGHGEGKYLLRAIPNTPRGKVFLRMFREYLNRDAFTHYIQGRKDEGTWSHSLNQLESDSFVLYVKPKEKEWFKERQENIEAKLLNVTNLKNHKLDILERKVIELQTELNAIRTDIENIER
jgi:hypothetical protein|tara:strand:+ start:426 stop:827 length:402 start_codon:yes stop_codon:yes gene_type:complete